MVTAADPFRVVDDPFGKEGNDSCFGGGLGDCDAKWADPISEDPLVEADRWGGGRDLLLP